MLTMQRPIFGFTFTLDLCATGPGSAAGSWLGSGALAGSGSFNAAVSSSGAPDFLAAWGTIEMRGKRGEFGAITVEAPLNAHASKGRIVFIGKSG